MLRHVRLLSTRSVFEHSPATQPATPDAHISPLEFRLSFAFLTFHLRLQENYDVQTTSKRNKACEKNQPQGIIVDFFKKQAQQPPSGKGSGLRLLDASLSGNTRIPEDPSKSSTLSDYFPDVLRNRHHLGKCDYITETVDCTRRLHDIPCDADPLSTSRRPVHTKTALPICSSYTRTDSRFSISGDCATLGSGASQSGSPLQSAQELSTRASIDQSLLGSYDVDVTSGHSLDVLPGIAIPPHHQALPVSSPPRRTPDVASSLINQTLTSVHDDPALLHTCLPLEFQTQVSTSFAPLQASTHIYAQEPSVIEITSTRYDDVDEPEAFPTRNPQGAQMKFSEARTPQPQEGVLSNVEPKPGSQAAVTVSASQSKTNLPGLTHQRINDISFFALARMVIVNLARSSAPSECPPVMSWNRMDMPPRSTPVHRRAPTPGLPALEPELVGAPCLSLPRAGESAYNHPALRPSIDDDAEWSTLPKRKLPPPPAQSKNSITSSAKFLLPIRMRAPSPPTESREVEAGKRPRITLYRPPPRTAAIDLAGLESRFACVRSAMRKVRVHPYHVSGLLSWDEACVMAGRADHGVRGSSVAARRRQHGTRWDCPAAARCTLTGVARRRSGFFSGVGQRARVRMGGLCSLFDYAINHGFGSTRRLFSTCRSPVVFW